MGLGFSSLSALYLPETHEGFLHGSIPFAISAHPVSLDPKSTIKAERNQKHRMPFVAVAQKRIRIQDRRSVLCLSIKNNGVARRREDTGDPLKYTRIKVVAIRHLVDSANLAAGEHAGLFQSQPK